MNATQQLEEEIQTFLAILSKLRMLGTAIKLYHSQGFEQTPFAKEAAREYYRGVTDLAVMASTVTVTAEDAAKCYQQFFRETYGEEI